MPHPNQSFGDFLGIVSITFESILFYYKWIWRQKRKRDQIRGGFMYLYPNPHPILLLLGFYPYSHEYLLGFPIVYCCIQSFIYTEYTYSITFVTTCSMFQGWYENLIVMNRELDLHLLFFLRKKFGSGWGSPDACCGRRWRVEVIPHSRNGRGWSKTWNLEAGMVKFVPDPPPLPTLCSWHSGASHKTPLQIQYGIDSLFSFCTFIISNISFHLTS